MPVEAVLEEQVEPESKVTASVDVLILTQNERINLPYALNSILGWVHKIFVLDSGSTDGTQDIAREMGAVLVEHPWEGYARQKNWGLDNLPFESPWVFILDADEVITPRLAEEIKVICGRPSDEVEESGFYVNRYLIFMGKRIRHCGYFPSWNLRLFKLGAARYEERPVHEHMIVNGREGYLKGLMAHEDHRSLEYYIAKHNRYSTLEAEIIFHGHRESDSSVKPRFFGNSVQRKRYFKEKIYPHLPGRWLGRFIWMYFIRLGILDGAAGLRFCLLISSHELFTSLKLRELKLHKKEMKHFDHAEFDTTRNSIMFEPGSGMQGSRSIIAKPVQIDSPIHITESQSGNPIQHEPSPWTMIENIRRALWMVVRATIFHWSFHNWYLWRRLILRAFGAKIGRRVRIRPSALIEIPWNLEVGDDSIIGDEAIIYSLGKITIGRHVVISQYAHLCAGTHDYTRRTFPLMRPPIVIEDEAWIAADAFVGPGVRVGARAVVGARATAIKDIPSDEVFAGLPARFIKKRELRN